MMIPLRHAWLLSLFLLVLWPASCVRAEISLRAQIEPGSVELGEAAMLSVTVEGANRVGGRPEMAAVPGLEVQSRGQSSNLQIVNGRMSQSISFQYAVFATKAGTYSIGPFILKEGGKTYRGEAVTFQAIKPGAAPGAGGTPKPVDDGSSFAEGALFVRMVADKERAALGEQVTLRFQFWRRTDVPLMDQSSYTPPDTPGFWREELPPQRSGQRTFNGANYEVTELVYALFATQPGRLEVAKAGLECTVPVRSRRRDPFDVFGMLGGMGEPRRVTLETKPLRIQVDPLPAGAPESFTGGVGQYRLRGSLDRNQAAQNEPLTLSLQIEGTGNVSAVGDPKLPDLVDFRSYPPTGETEPNQDGDKAGGKKVWKIVLVPESTGAKKVPAIELTTYDPVDKRYETHRVGPFEVQIVPAGNIAAGEAPGEVTRVGRDLRAIRVGGELKPGRPSGSFGGAIGVSLQVLPAVLLAAAWAYRRRLERDQADRIGVRSRRAPGRFRREMEMLQAGLPGAGEAAGEGWRRFGDALERYFTERFNFPVRGRTRDELASCLSDAGVDAAAIEEVRSLLDRCDFALFAPAAATEQELRAALQQALGVADRLDAAKGRARPRSGGGPGRGVLALLALLQISGGALAQTGGSLTAPLDPSGARAAFEAGNQAYQAGDYGEAVRAYRSVRDSGYLSADLLLNLGNACYRAGRLGWAVEAFERGRRLYPGDPDLEANLELALAETRDRQAETEGSPLLGALVALQERWPLRSAVRFSTVCWWLLALWGAWRIVTGPSTPVMRWVGRGFTAALIASLAWTGVLALRDLQRPNAVVVAEELSVRSNPDFGGTVEFTLHAGTLVRLGRARGEFREVLFSDRLKGWADAVSLARLD
ncbi:MAG: BatD family protein [Candidatus Eisenbacteria bacterium]|nr:BatD family protein [Candidatus Eisenbacteria bacterium]